MGHRRSRDTRKRELPQHVVCVCSSKPGRERYGVKLSYKKKQLRIGSQYHDPQSAS